MTAFRKSLAAALASGWDFVQRRPGPALLISLLFGAACAGAIYLILARNPGLFDLSCFVGACPR